MNQEELANKMEISRMTLRSIIQCKTDVKFDVLAKFQKISGCDLNALVKIKREYIAIIDTSIFIQRPRYLYEVLKKCDRVYIPKIVLSELMNLKNKRQNANLALSVINRARSNKLDLNMTSNAGDDNDDRILDVAKQLATKNRCNLYYLLTNDKDFKIKFQNRIDNLKIISADEFDEEFIGIEEYDREESFGFFKAVKDKNYELAKEFTGELHKYVDFNYINEIGYTPLIQAIRNKDHKMVELLLNIPNVDVDKVDDNKYALPPISHAIQLHDEKMVKLLIDHGADVNEPSQDEKNPFNMPLMIASWHGDLAIVKQLLKHDASINQVDRGNGYTALIKASIKNHPDCVKLLLEHGADKNIYSFDRKTALDYALEQNRKKTYAEVIRLLKGNKHD